MFWVLYWSGIELNTKGQVLTPLSQIYWTLKHSGTN